MRNIVIEGRTHLIADDGKRVTNGKDVYGLDIILAVGTDDTLFYEITEEEYRKIMAEEEQSASAIMY